MRQRPQEAPGLYLTPSPILVMAAISRRLWDDLTPAEQFMVKQVLDDREMLKADGSVDWEPLDASLSSFQTIQQAING